MFCLPQHGEWFFEHRTAELISLGFPFFNVSALSLSWLFLLSFLFLLYVGWGIFCAYWLTAFLLRSKAAFLCRGLPPWTAAPLIVNNFPTVTRPDSHPSMPWLHSSMLNISPAVLMARAASKRAPFYINSGWMGVISHAKLMEENSSCPLLR